ncbi:MAG TPA: sensor histidine kinase [Bacteriovoracaceae bacterium]|nr:sensor histidine kinase [Bacteriovoracaceae bacterium]
MPFLNKLKVTVLPIGIIITALLTFILALWAVFIIHATDLVTKKIVDEINGAQKVSRIDSSINLERAFKFYDSGQTFGLFSEDCIPIYINDLILSKELCLIRNPTYTWITIMNNSGSNWVIGYKKDISFVSFVKEYFVILLTVTLCYLLFVTLITFYSFKIFLYNPLTRITEIIDELLLARKFNPSRFILNSSSITTPLYITVLKLINEVLRHNSEEEKVKISRQVVHDLRAPLSILEREEGFIDTGNNLNYHALKRIREISNCLVDNANFESVKELNLNDLLNEFRVLYPQLDIATNIEPPLKSAIEIELAEIEIFRFLSNIFKNSVEANSSKIAISASISDQCLILTTKDNGEGMSEDSIPEILKGKTFKKDGHGLGISSIKERLEQVGGFISINTSKHSGFETILNIPLSKSLQYILIDDDKLIRANWNHIAKSKGITLSTFKSVNDFLENSIHFSQFSHVYIDSNLGFGSKGELEAKCIFNKGFKTIYLATGFNSSDFDISDFPWIKEIKTKAPPF